MLLAFAWTTLVLVAGQQVDTTLAVGRSQRLDVNSYGGEIIVRAWAQSAVRVEAKTPDEERVEVSSSQTAVRVRTQGRHGPSEAITLRISVPSWMALNLAGVNTTVKVEGVRAPITVETVEGEIDVSGGDGLISLRSVQGSVRLRGGRGRITLNSVNEDVEVSRSTGDIVAQTVNGEINLKTVNATSIDANTVNGDISYSGPIRSGGRYALSTHNGDISLTVAEGTNASVAVSTFSGEFESEFPVPFRGTQKGKGFNFTLGNGSAQVSLESFQGTIELVRPGSERDPARREEHEHD